MCYSNDSSVSIVTNYFSQPNSYLALRTQRESQRHIFHITKRERVFFFNSKHTFQRMFRASVTVWHSKLLFLKFYLKFDIGFCVSFGLKFWNLGNLYIVKHRLIPLIHCSRIYETAQWPRTVDSRVWIRDPLSSINEGITQSPTAISKFEMQVWNLTGVIFH